jgi:AcrR family transcriptional regulator
LAPRAGLDKEKVLAAAAEIVDRDGAGGLTVGALAAQLGVRPPSLYNHMESLEQLQQVLAARALGELAACMRGAATGRAGAEALRAVAAAYRGYVLAHPGLYGLTVRVRPLDEAYVAASDETVKVVLAVLRGYQLSEKDAVHAARSLRSAVHGFASLEAAGGFGMPFDVAESFDWLINVMDQGLRGAGRE